MKDIIDAIEGLDAPYIQEIAERVNISSQTASKYLALLESHKMINTDDTHRPYTFITPIENGLNGWSEKLKRFLAE